MWCEPPRQYYGMDITVGALQSKERKEVRRRADRVTEGLSLGDTEFFHGIHPQFKFIDEKHFEQWEKEQIEHKQRLSEIRRRRIERHNEIAKYAHNHLLCKAGPEWYQELSPQQKELLDNLKTNMKKDLDSHLTKQTKSRLSLLGMRPLPNDQQIWKALTMSFGCPVEFLLVLYNLIKPNFRRYTVNDKLLLSSVVHLSLRDTLREMHIRSPSPPKIEKPPPPPKPEPKKKRYPSVYLMPFTFRWKIRKYTTYKNPVIQRPTCQYFSYICDLEGVRLRPSDDVHQDDRIDEDLKIPCELFDDHLVAEDYYNLMFKRQDTAKYILRRPRIYETSVPKTYPGILPPSLSPKKYPTPFKLIVDVKIYDEVDSKNQDRTKVIRIICEVREKPAGRPGQSAAQHLLAKYVEKMSIEEYVKKGSDADIVEIYDRDFPCSICGGPEKKIEPFEMKPIKQKSWIKRPYHKKKRELIYTNLSEYMNSEEIKVVSIDEKGRKLIKENQEYVDKWNQLFENIKLMEKLKLEATECTCPDKSTDHKRFDPQIDCTCAPWKLPTPPKSSDLSCECKPTVEEDTYIYPREDKCDCLKKAKEMAMEKCEECGIRKEKTEKELAEQGECECTKKLEACGNCAKETPMKFPLLEGETKKECECTAKLAEAEAENEFTVAYVFVDNKIPGGFSNSNENEICECQQPNKEIESIFEKKEKKKSKKEKKDVAGCSQENKGDSSGKAKREESKFSVQRSKIFELDRCREETEKLLDKLKCPCPKCKELRNKHRARFYQAGTRDGCGGPIPVIGGVYGAPKECDCLEKFEEKVKGIQDYKQRMKAKVKLKSAQHKYVISGVQQTPKGPIYNITGVMPKRPCICRTAEEILKEKQKGEEFSNSLKPGLKYLISGVRGGEGSREYIISGATKECDCTRAYEKFMEEHNECLVNYERYLTYMQKEIQAFMEDVQERYQDPPMPEREVIEKEIKKMTGAPGLPLPDGKSNFLISGLRVNEESKDFVLGGVPLNRWANEERIIRVESYSKDPDKKDLPTKCQKIFLCNYVTLGKDCGNPFRFQQKKEICIKNSSEEVLCRCISYGSSDSETVENEEVEEEEEEEIDGCACECPCGVEIIKPKDCSCAKEKSEESCVCPKSSDDELEGEEEEIKTPEGCTCGYITPESSGTASDPCLCRFKNCGCQADEVCVKECFYGPMEAWWSTHEMPQVEKVPTPNEEESIDLITAYGGPSKRYVVCRQIPRRPKHQITFLQKLLNGLADDGYPIAQLPEIHRLPYFELWLQLRMRKKWKYDDKVRNLKQCKILWNHIFVCRKRRVPLPKLPIHCVCERNTFTWRDAFRASKMVRETRKKFYDKLRENMVDFGREFYTTLYPYIYHNPAYFNHFFYAYQPGKVENAVAEYIWGG